MFNRQEDYDEFEAAMAKKILAEAKLTASKSSLFELCGWSGIIAATSGAVWVAGLVVANYNGQKAKPQEAERVLVERVANALAATPLKVEIKLADGTVHLAPDAQVTVRGMVGLSPDASVGVDPSRSTVRVAAQAPDARPASGAPVKTDVVQFSTVSYGAKKGNVVTAWDFSDANKQTPAKQWCHYREPQPDGTTRLVTIGEDGHRVGLPTPSPFPTIDLEGAVANCVWNSRTPATAKAPAEKPDKAPPPPSHAPVVSARKG